MFKIFLNCNLVIYLLREFRYITKINPNRIPINNPTTINDKLMLIIFL